MLLGACLWHGRCDDAKNGSGIKKRHWTVHCGSRIGFRGRFFFASVQAEVAVMPFFRVMDQAAMKDGGTAVTIVLHRVIVLRGSFDDLLCPHRFGLDLLLRLRGI